MDRVDKVTRNIYLPKYQDGETIQDAYFKNNRALLVLAKSIDEDTQNQCISSFLIAGLLVRPLVR